MSSMCLSVCLSVCVILEADSTTPECYVKSHMHDLAKYSRKSECCNNSHLCSNGAQAQIASTFKTFPSVS